MNAHFTFRKKTDFKKFIKMMLSSGGLAVFFGFLGDLYVLSPFITFGIYIVVNPIIGFLLTKYYVFSSRN